LVKYFFSKSEWFNLQNKKLPVQITSGILLNNNCILTELNFSLSEIDLSAKNPTFLG